MNAPPTNLCMLRLSALGDVTHALPLVHTLQSAWPDTPITWIIGRLEHQLVGSLPGVRFIQFDKQRGWRAYRDLQQQLTGERFDVLLHMQVALRANLAGRMVRSRRRIGFDRARSRDGHGLFVHQRIAPQARAHVLDGFLAFASALGIHEHHLQWHLPVPAAAQAFALASLPQDTPVLVINPCTSARLNNWRNWSAERYAAVIDHAAGQHGLHAVLTGGPTPAEQAMAEAIIQHSRHRPTSLVGRTTPSELAAVMQIARVAIAPDTGPLHIANAVGTPVIGLYATSNPERTGPYLWREWCVNRYPEALMAETGKSPEQVRWGTRVRNEQAMLRISADEVTAQLDALLRHLASTAGKTDGT